MEENHKASRVVFFFTPVISTDFEVNSSLLILTSNIDTRLLLNQTSLKHFMLQFQLPSVASKIVTVLETVWISFGAKTRCYTSDGVSFKAYLP